MISDQLSHQTLSNIYVYKMLEVIELKSHQEWSGLKINTDV